MGACFKQVRMQLCMGKYKGNIAIWQHVGRNTSQGRYKQVCHKLVPKWKDPYMVVIRFGTVHEVLTTYRVSRLYHSDLLKPCHKEEFPPWIKLRHPVRQDPLHPLLDCPLQLGSRGLPHMPFSIFTTTGSQRTLHLEVDNIFLVLPGGGVVCMYLCSLYSVYLGLLQARFYCTCHVYSELGLLKGCGRVQRPHNVWCCPNGVQTVIETVIESVVCIMICNVTLNWLPTRVSDPKRWTDCKSMWW